MREIANQSVLINVLSALSPNSGAGPAHYCDAGGLLNQLLGEFGPCVRLLHNYRLNDLTIILDVEH
jgi:hypothetical protein